MLDKVKKFLAVFTLIAVLAMSALPALAAPPAQGGQDVVDIAVADGRFTTLVTALTEAGLVDTLKGAGPFTVFAPTDEAFAKLPDGALAGLLADKAALSKVLLYHVVSGNVMAADVVNLTSAATVEGQSVKISTADGNVMVDGAKVVITDIAGTNGVIHVIDSVLMPPAEEMMAEPAMADAKDIVDIAVADGRFTTLVTALTEAGLVDTLKGAGPFTVFAPTDEAFAKLPDGALAGLLADKAALSKVLLYHVVSGNVMAADVVNLTSAATVEGQPVAIAVDNGTVKINDAQVLITDIAGSNGVIHVIDSVLMPPAEEMMAAPAEAPATLPVSGGDVSTGTNNIIILAILGLIMVSGAAAVRLVTVRNRS